MIRFSSRMASRNLPAYQPQPVLNPQLEHV